MTEDREELKLALVQAQLDWHEPQANREHLEELIREQAEDADIVILPETFTTGFLGDPGVAEEGMDGETVAWMRGLATSRGCVLTGSAVIVTADGRRNRLLWVEPDGTVQHYDKRHLFAYGGENERYVAGAERVVFEYRGWRVFPLVCYDIRFPVWCRVRDDYDLMLVVANWPRPRVDAWSTLLKARAIENQCYVAAVNRVGRDGKGIDYPGRSVVHDALGAELLLMDDRESVAHATVRLDKLRAVRAKLPFLADADRFTVES